MIYVNVVSLINALGNNDETILANLAASRSPGMRAVNGWLAGGKTCELATVTDPVPSVPSEWIPAHESRNNGLLLAAYDAKKDAFDKALAGFDPARVAVVLGTSTSGSDEAAHYVAARMAGEDQSAFDARAQELGDPARFLSAYLGLTGPAYTISTACTSSTRAIISAARLIKAGLADAVIAGGADTLAGMPINGFDALGALSLTRCKPFAQDRGGITIGEGGGLMLLTKTPSDVALLGYGESADAHHMSAPDPQGIGAEKAMRAALEKAGLEPEMLDYINMHGTGTALNDAAETQAVARIFADKVPVSSTKNLTGHTLGAAGITDAGLVCLMLAQNGVSALPAQTGDPASIDSSLETVDLIVEPRQINMLTAMSNNFAFGGNNASLIFGVPR